MSKSEYKRATYSDYLKRLKSSGYKSLRAARCAASRSVGFSVSEKARAHAAAKKYFSDNPVTQVSDKEKSAPIKKATVKAFTKEAPFCVTFAKVEHLHVQDGPSN